MGSLFVLFITFYVLGCVSCEGKLCGNTSVVNTSSCTKQVSVSFSTNALPDVSIWLMEEGTTVSLNSLIRCCFVLILSAMG